MKNKLLPLLFVLGSFSAYSQVVIGKQEVTPSAQLEVFATNKGMLIPRVELKEGSASKFPIVLDAKESEVPSSLLVFNTYSGLDVKPGYYYWYNNKWNRIINSDEAAANTNVVVGTGIPGDKGQQGYPGEAVTLYTDKNTGTVYVQNADGTWTSINGKNGLDGKNGIAGGEGVPGAAGTPGIDATIQMYVDYNTGIVYVRDPKDKSKWVKISGRDGVDGAAGLAGGPGIPGKDAVNVPPSTSAWIDTTTGYVYVKDADGNWVRVSGKDGVDGAAGLAGGAGIPGKDGVNAPADTTAWIDTTTGIVYIKDADGNWVKVSGNNGKDGIIGIKGDPGDDGVVIPAEATILVNDAGVVFIKDPATGKWIKVSGRDGVDGAAGLAGGKGVPGKDAVNVPASATTWIDTTTGYVYVKDPITGEWIKVSGKDGVDGAAGLAGGPGIPGKNGVDAPAGTTAWIDTTTGTVYIKDADGNWVKVSGNNGKDGIIGIKGDPGDDGVVIPAEATILVNDAGVVFIKDPATGKWIKVSGRDGVDGAAGLAGGKGVPGKDAVNVPASATTWIDTTTGYVYVKDPVTGEWIKVSGKDGVDGAAGLAGGPGIPGKNGVDAPAGTTAWIDTTTGTVYIKDADGNWVKVSGNNGKDGIIGIKGDPGDDGVVIPAEATILVNDAGVVFIKDPATGKWIKVSGRDGVDGAAGLAGGKGVPGKDALNVPASATTWIDTTTGYVYVKDPVTGEWIKVSGKDGVDGAAGLAGGPGIPGKNGVDAPAGTTAWIDTTTGTVYIKDADGNWVKVSGNNGKDGIIGIKGDPGDDGVVIPAEATILVNDAGVVFIKDPATGKWIKVSGRDGVDGAAGLAGGKGVPGKDALNVPASATTWIDTTTGYVYVKDPVTGEWIKVSGKDGVDGAAGLAGGPGVPGKDAVNVPASATTWIDTRDGSIYVKDTITGEWIKVNAKETLTSLIFDKVSNKLTYTNENKEANDIDLTDAIKAGETKTTLLYNATASTLTYTGEGATEIIKLADITTTTPDTVLSVTGTAATFAPSTVNIVPSTVVGDVLTTSEAGKVAWKAPEKSNIMSIKVIAQDYTVADDDYTIIAEGQTGDITINLPDPAVSKGRMLIINQFDTLMADGQTALVVNFNYDLRYSSKASYSYLTASIFAGVTSGSLKVTLQSDGTKWYVITYTM